MLKNLRFLSVLVVSILFTGIVFTGCKKDKDQPESELGGCKGVSPGTGLSKISETVYLYESSKGATIRIERTSPGGLVVRIGDKAYSNFNVEFWGGSENTDELSPASHENLNGKHIKDKLGTNRTVIFTGGTKMTFAASGPWYHGAVTAISIYDGDIVHHFNMTCFTLEYSAVNATLAKQWDEEQPDGETSTYDITETGLIFYNIYTEDIPGQKVEQRVNLGGLIRGEPNLINDYYDDPRIGHT